MNRLLLCDSLRSSQDKNDGFYGCWYTADVVGTYDVLYGSGGGEVIGSIVVS